MSALKNRLAIIIGYIIGFIFIIDCRSLYQTTFNLGNYLNIILIFLMVIYLGLVMKKIQKNVLVNTIEVSGIIILYLLIYGIFKSQGLKFYELVIIILLSFWIIRLGPWENKIPRILTYYGNLISIVALVAIFFWIFGSVLKIISPSGVVSSTWGASNGGYNLVPTYHNLYFETQKSDFTFTIWGTISRNSAIFTEGPMASLNFSIGLLTQLYRLKSKWGKLKTIILILAILTTFSVTGYILLLGLGLIFLVRQSKKIPNELISYFYGFVLLLIVILTVVVLYNSKLSSNAASVSVRKDDYMVGFRAWLSNPILGIGIQNYGGLKNFMESWRYFNTGFSNSVMDILSGGGIYLGAGYLFCFIKGFIDSYKSDEKKVLFILAMFYLFVTTFFTYTDILLFCMVWFACRNREN